MSDLSPAEAAQDLGIATNTLRTWAREFAPLLSSQAQGGKRSRRMYTAADMTLLRHAAMLLDQGLSYQQIQQQFNQHGNQVEGENLPKPQIATDSSRHDAMPHAAMPPLPTGVTILDEWPEVEALRLLLDAQRGTLEAQRSTLEVQSQLIAQLQQQHSDDRAALDQAQQQIVDTRADLVEQLAEVRAQLLRVPRWLRALLGLGD